MRNQDIKLFKLHSRARVVRAKCLVATFYNPDFISTLKITFKFSSLSPRGRKLENLVALMAEEGGKKNVLASANEESTCARGEKRLESRKSTIVLNRFRINFKCD